MLTLLPLIAAVGRAPREDWHYLLYVEGIGWLGKVEGTVWL